MDRAEEYLRRAERAEAEAAFMGLSDHKRQLLDLADQWRDLARRSRELAADEAKRAKGG